MYDVYREAYFSLKNMYKWAKYVFVILSLSWKESPWNGNTLSGKEKFMDTAVSKEDHADSLLGHESTFHYWIPWKKDATVNNASYY